MYVCMYVCDTMGIYTCMHEYYALCMTMQLCLILSILSLIIIIIMHFGITYDIIYMLMHENMHDIMQLCIHGIM